MEDIAEVNARKGVTVVLCSMLEFTTRLKCKYDSSYF